MRSFHSYSKISEAHRSYIGAELAAKKGYNPYALCDLFDRLSQNIKDRIAVQIGNLSELDDELFSKNLGEPVERENLVFSPIFLVPNRSYY